MLGVNDRVALAQVRALAQRAILERHMLAGVTIVDPGTHRDRRGRVDRPGRRDRAGQCSAAIDGRGAGAVVGPHTTAIDSRIGDGASVRVSWLSEAVLHAGASVGPFAYLRPGAVLREGAKAGTFVEIKNSDVGPGAKIPHLSYIGDADVGEAHQPRGRHDHRELRRPRQAPHVRSAARVRGGVDTAFVAPVTVGDGAYTAAGSVVTEDVPPGALGVARARQSNIEGYAERRARAQPRGVRRPPRPECARRRRASRVRARPPCSAICQCARPSRGGPLHSAMR